MSDRQFIERHEDMSPRGRLWLIIQVDGDVIVSVVPDPTEGDGSGGSVEFCTPFFGGGRSPHTIKALHELAAAMERDNTENPIPRRPLDPQEKGGA